MKEALIVAMKWLVPFCLYVAVAGLVLSAFAEITASLVTIGEAVDIAADRLRQSSVNLAVYALLMRWLFE